MTSSKSVPRETFSHAATSARTESRWAMIPSTASPPSGRRTGVVSAVSAVRIAAAAFAGSPGWVPSPFSTKRRVAPTVSA